MAHIEEVQIVLIHLLGELVEERLASDVPGVPTASAEPARHDRKPARRRSELNRGSASIARMSSCLVSTHAVAPDARRTREIGVCSRSCRYSAGGEYGQVRGIGKVSSGWSAISVTVTPKVIRRDALRL